ncbi:Cytochrome b6 [Bienertia sinuspersici]
MSPRSLLKSIKYLALAMLVRSLMKFSNNIVRMLLIPYLLRPRPDSVTRFTGVLALLCSFKGGCSNFNLTWPEPGPGWLNTRPLMVAYIILMMIMIMLVLLLMMMLVMV